MTTQEMQIRTAALQGQHEYIYARFAEAVAHLIIMYKTKEKAQL